MSNAVEAYLLGGGSISFAGIAYLEDLRTPLKHAANLREGDIVSRMHAKAYPGRVTSVNVTPKARLTVRYADGALSTVKPVELYNVFTEEDLDAALALKDEES